MDSCRHLIDAAAKSGRYFLAEFFECGAAESKNFDKCHVKLLNICLIESPLQICHNNADRPVEMGRSAECGAFALETDAPHLLCGNL